MEPALAHSQPGTRAAFHGALRARLEPSAVSLSSASLSFPCRDVSLSMRRLQHTSFAQPLSFHRHCMKCTPPAATATPRAVPKAAASKQERGRAPRAPSLASSKPKKAEAEELEREQKWHSLFPTPPPSFSETSPGADSGTATGSGGRSGIATGAGGESGAGAGAGGGVSSIDALRVLKERLAGAGTGGAVQGPKGSIAATRSKRSSAPSPQPMAVARALQGGAERVGSGATASVPPLHGVGELRRLSTSEWEDWALKVIRNKHKKQQGPAQPQTLAQGAPTATGAGKGTGAGRGLSGARRVGEEGKGGPGGGVKVMKKGKKKKDSHLRVEVALNPSGSKGALNSSGSGSPQSLASPPTLPSSSSSSSSGSTPLSRTPKGFQPARSHQQQQQQQVLTSSAGAQVQQGNGKGSKAKGARKVMRALSAVPLAIAVPHAAQDRDADSDMEEDAGRGTATGAGVKTLHTRRPQSPPPQSPLRSTRKQALQLASGVVLLGDLALDLGREESRGRGFSPSSSSSLERGRGQNGVKGTHEEEEEGGEPGGLLGVRGSPYDSVKGVLDEAQWEWVNAQEMEEEEEDDEGEGEEEEEGFLLGSEMEEGEEEEEGWGSSRSQWARVHMRRREEEVVQLLRKEGMGDADLQRFLDRRRAPITTGVALVQERVHFLRTELGLSAAQLSSLLALHPRVLSLPVESSLRPHVAFLRSLGLPEDHLRRVLRLAPKIFEYSIERSLAPRIRFLQEEVGIPEAHLAGVIWRSPQVLTQSIKGGLVPRLQFFRKELGIPRANFAQMVTRHPQLLHYSLGQGIRPRVRLFLRWGMTLPDVALVLQRCPQVLSLSVENNLGPKFEYLVRHLGCSVHSVVSFPAYFSLSLTNRIMPRHRFLALRRAQTAAGAPPTAVPTDPKPWETPLPGAAQRGAAHSGAGQTGGVPSHSGAVAAGVSAGGTPGHVMSKQVRAAAGAPFPLSWLALKDDQFCARLGERSVEEYHAFLASFSEEVAGL